MCLEQILTIILAAVTAGAVITQAYFAKRLYGVSKKQTEIIEKQKDIMDKQTQISEWANNMILLTDMRKERDLLAYKLTREQQELEKLKRDLENADKNKEEQEREDEGLTEEELEFLKKELELLESEDKKLKQEREKSTDPNIDDPSNSLSYSYPANKERSDRWKKIKLSLNKSEGLKKIRDYVENLESSKKKAEKSIVDLEADIAFYDKKIGQTKESLTKVTKSNQT